MPVPLHPAVPALAGLQALLERQRTALHDGHPDDLPALSAQLQLQMAQIKSAAAQLTPPIDEAAIAQLHALNQLAITNMAMLQRRMVGNEDTLRALGASSQALQAAQQQQTYAHEGRLSATPLGGRMLGQA